MRARVPLDVDMEDRLVYGLTPTRLAYVVLAGLLALAVWESHLALSPLRAIGSVLVLAAGVALAWGRWRGRAADRWVFDLALFVLSTRRLRRTRPPS